MTETLLVQKVAYIHAGFLEREWFRCLSSVLRNMSYELEKKFDIFLCFFGKKIKYEKNFLTLFLCQNVAYETLVQFTKPLTMYSVSALRYRGSNMKSSQK